jgi:N-acetylglucosaminyldiphosphoundecaprenol N-acetyl-beta-D-mannosaminyltransferase
MTDKIKILNIGFNPLNYNEIVELLQDNKNRKGYICFPDLYNIIRANEDRFLFEIYNNSALTLPDGTPSKWFLRCKGIKNAATISGYWLCKKLLATNLSHFFYGTTEHNLNLMKQNISNSFPNANILGFKSPPQVSEELVTTDKQLAHDMGYILPLKPDILWIGVSSPKQDKIMAHFNSQCEGTIMIGVGAVFDYFAGTAYKGPEWAKKIGARWVFQLIYDPKRYLGRIIHILVKLPRLLITGHL